MSVRRNALLFALIVAISVPASGLKRVIPTGKTEFPVDTTGVYVPSTGQWLLRNSNTAGDPDIAFKFGGLAGDLPVTGDWDADGQTDFAIFRDGIFLRARLSDGESFCIPCTPEGATQSLGKIVFGQDGDLPVAGDWNGDGVDDVGVFRPGPQGTFLLRVPAVERPCLFCPPRLIITTRTIILGSEGDVPIAGDWNADGIDDVGVYQPSTATFILSEDGAKPTFFFAFGVPRDRPLAGDWNGTGKDGIGVFQPAIPTMVLSPEIPPLSEIEFHLGVPSEGIPVAGHWTALP